MKAALREPVVHFVALGAMLFLYFEWRGESGRSSSRIVITEGTAQTLAAGFARSWMRPPSPEELKGLVDEFVKEEIATREALAIGLDQGDTVVRRRLRQKLEFLAEDAAEQAPPTDAELEQWLKAHPATFQADPQLALRQVFVSGSRRGAATAADAERLLARLRQAGPEANAAALGDASMLPAELPLADLSEVARTFGSAFAEGIAGLPERTWAGPIESAYGLHLVLITERRSPPPPSLAEIRPRVERELLEERRRARLDALYEDLLKKYSVTIEAPAPEGAAKPGAAGARDVAAEAATGRPR